MSEDGVELLWSGFTTDMPYELHRFTRAADPDPDLAEPSDSSLLYRGDGTEFFDDSVRGGEQYWYVLFAEVSEGVGRRWTPADAVTDKEPPAKVTGLRLDQAADEVTLTWDQTTDNYAFARYAIRRSVDDEQSVYYGTGWTIDQTSFVDDQLPSRGVVTYELIATDFHGNASQATTASFTIGS